MTAILKGLPALLLMLIVLLFGSLAPSFLSTTNLAAIVAQASWLVVLALGVNLVLISGAVDLSIGSVMYLTVVVISVMLPGLPFAWWIPAALTIGFLAGWTNGWLVTRFALPAFIVTLATAFILRGVGLWVSDTQMVAAPDGLAILGRATSIGMSVPVLLASLAFVSSAILLKRTTFGLYVRAIGADADGSSRVGVPNKGTLLVAFGLSGSLAGLAGLVSFSQTAAVTAAFGLNAEFLAIAAAVLGGTSLFGGRGTAEAPIAGAILITTVQNGLVMINANPYAYPVVTGAIIFLAALLDSIRRRLVGKLERPTILAPASVGQI